MTFVVAEGADQRPRPSVTLTATRRSSTRSIVTACSALGNGLTADAVIHELTFLRKHEACR
jgi:hypothetical protein